MGITEMFKGGRTKSRAKRREEKFMKKGKRGDDRRKKAWEKMGGKERKREEDRGKKEKRRETSRDEIGKHFTINTHHGTWVTIRLYRNTLQYDAYCDVLQYSTVPLKCKTRADIQPPVWFCPHPLAV